MPKKVRSMRGEIIDWDRAAIKNQLASQPAPANVGKRQDFIDAKLRRRVNKVKGQLSQLSSTKVDRKIAGTPVEQQEKIDENVKAAEQVAEEKTSVKTTETKSEAPAKKRTVRRKTTKSEE